MLTMHGHPSVLTRRFFSRKCCETSRRPPPAERYAKARGCWAAAGVMVAGIGVASQVWSAGFFPETIFLHLAIMAWVEWWNGIWMGRSGRVSGRGRQRRRPDEMIALGSHGTASALYPIRKLCVALHINASRGAAAGSESAIGAGDLYAPRFEREKNDSVVPGRAGDVVDNQAGCARFGARLIRPVACRRAPGLQLGV
jgi:hypothetical protein